MILYHYTTGQGVFGIFDKSELFCSNINFLNDPSEESYFKELLKDTFANSTKCKNIYETLYSESYQGSIVNPFDIFILSFSKNQDSLSMWNYYAKGNGYNIGLDIDKIIEANENENIVIQNVKLEYNKSEQIKAITNFLLSFEEQYDTFLAWEEEKNKAKQLNDEPKYHELNHEQGHIIERFNDEIYKLKIRFKHHAYEREEEVRLIISEDESKQNTTRFRVSENGVFVKFFPLKINLESSVKSLKAHPFCGDLHLDGLKKFVSSKIRNNDLEISRSKIPFRIV
uniref:DUF2971 domain-containing protein n=1 Tax=Roseihalotalea indica TaxID=2867963 RepID=A0AA49GSK7_9BACT|nr:DUF2971 domain-containing protein [Tunicatimonas sp. TK19036]